MRIKTEIYVNKLRLPYIFGEPFLPIRLLLRGALSPAAIRSVFNGNTDSFALTTLAVPKSCYSLGARTTFDRGARRCLLFPAPQALAPSLRMTSRLVIAVRVSCGHLCEAEAPTEPAGETAARRAAIRFFFSNKYDF